MAKQPAVVIIARHGPRLDAADQSWHLSTPTPYDPPLTYGGWNQSRSLGIRIASLLHTREQSFNEEQPTELPTVEGVKLQDFALQDRAGSRSGNVSEQGTRKRKRRHKVVIHSSPFLRCLQTSVAIAAGMAQFQPPSEPGSRSGTSSKSRTPNHMHSYSPRLRGTEGSSSPNLAPITEPKLDFAHAIARKALHEHQRHRKAKLRVDAFLGEWLNPQYFDHITPPPPSAMMVAAAKAELLHNETIDIFTPTVSSKSSVSSLWGGANGSKAGGSRDSALDDWSPVEDSLPSSTARRERSNSASSVGSNDSSSGKKSPRPGHMSQYFTSTVPKPEHSVYVPPIPQYAVSGSDHIPRGYVAHARHACTNADYQWDSSRPPQSWGDGGEYGEEWSTMHKRFRRGLNHLISWYSQHNADDRAEDALGIEQAERHHEDEEEDLVVVLVTHGAGSNALIGALTGQPVLLDVGMASLTMAVRKDDAPPLPVFSGDDRHGHSPDPTDRPNSPTRTAGADFMGLSSVYEMKLVSSSEHLRPGADPAKVPASSIPRNLRNGVDAGPHNRQRFGSGSYAPSGPGIESDWSLGEPARSAASSNSNLGSMRRPSVASSAAIAPAFPHPGGVVRSNTISTVPQTGGGSGLWTPPASRTPLLSAQKVKEERAGIFSSLNEAGGRVSPGRDLVLDFSNSPPDSRPTSSGGSKELLAKKQQAKPQEIPLKRGAMAMALDGTLESNTNEKPAMHERTGSVSELPKPGTSPPAALSRTLSQRGLWGSKPAGDKVARRFPQEPKRRWTVNQDDAAGTH